MILLSCTEGEQMEEIDGNACFTEGGKWRNVILVLRCTEGERWGM